jgi:hypothetical protein
MSTLLAVVDQNYAWLGMVPMGVIAVALIFNVASLHTKDMNRKSGIATNLLFIALIIEAAAWTVRAFGGGTETGVFWAIIASAFLHMLSGAIALLAFWEHRTIGKWPHGRRRATWGFWLNVIALLVIAGWFYLGTDPKLYKRIFE